MLWARAMGAILANPQAIKDVLVQRTKDPHTALDRDFFRECAWAIYVAGFPVETVKEKWPALEQAFCYWDYKQVCQDKPNVRAAALRVINNTRKVDAVINIAEWLCQKGWEEIKPQLLYSLKSDNQGNLIPAPELIPDLDQLPMIGRTNAIYILKNLGYDVAKLDRRLTRLALRFGYTGDENGVQEFTSDISKLVAERISVVETVLWNASSSKADLSFQCPCCGRQR
jgi:hypothetical protein